MNDEHGFDHTFSYQDGKNQEMHANPGFAGQSFGNIGIQNEVICFHLLKVDTKNLGVSP